MNDFNIASEHPLVPNPPENWETVTSEPFTTDGEGWVGGYGRTISGLTGAIRVESKPDTDTVSINMIRYVKENLGDANRELCDIEVPKIEDKETIDQLAEDWENMIQNGDDFDW